jgi:hypothetical protein
MGIQNFWVDIEDSSGARCGSGPLRAAGFTISKLLSASGEFSFDISGADANLAALAVKRVAICRYVEGGTVKVFGGGVIDKITAEITTGGLVYTVTGNDILRELTYRSVGSLALESSGAGVTNGPSQVMALAPAGWTLTGGTTTTPVYVGYDGESVLTALVGIGAKIGEHWRLGSGREIVWLGPASGFVSSGVRAVQHVNDPVAAEDADDIAVISSLEEEADATDLITRIIPRGSGTGSTILTLAAATDTAPAGYTLDKPNNFLKYDAGETAHGRIERVVDFKDIGPLTNTTVDVQSAANALLENGYQYLRLYGAAHKFYKLELASVNQILEPGTLLRVVYRQLVDGAVVYDLDNDFIILSVKQSLDPTGLHTTQVEVATIDRMPDSDGAYMASQVASSRILSVHQQLGPSVDTLTWRDELDDSYPASFRFWLGSEYTTIRQAMLRFKIQPLRSTVKSVGATSTTTSSGGAGTWTATDEISWGSDNTSVPLPFSELEHHHAIGATMHSHPVDIPSHTHDVTAAIVATYGIFAESGGNTLVIGNLVITLNGGADLASSVVDIGNGWYALDISAGLVDAIFRPVQENNEIVISTGTAKTARLEAQLTISGVVQAVSYA